MLYQLNELGLKERLEFEDYYSLAAIVSAMDSLPAALFYNAADGYNTIVTDNDWFFPTHENDLSLLTFLRRWATVHIEYFKLAVEIFASWTKGGSCRVLAVSSLLSRVIQSETARGWVGDQSPSGLSAMLNNRCEQVRELLDLPSTDGIVEAARAHFGDPTRMTPENELVKHLAVYQGEVGQELTRDMLAEPHDSVLLLLREHCKYSLADFNLKRRAMNEFVQQPHPLRAPTQAGQLATERFTSLVGGRSNLMHTKLNEVRVLDEVWQLEVKHGPKSWAGLMHGLVFAACSAATGKSDVYAMRSALS